MTQVAASVNLDEALAQVNQYEQQVFEADRYVDKDLWAQAICVSNWVAQGLSQRALANGWINRRTQQPYSTKHVRNVLQVVGVYSQVKPRPLFRDVYYLVSNDGALGPEDAKAVWGVITATAPDGKVTPAHIKAVSAVARDILASDALDDGEGNSVPFSELPAERKQAILRANLGEEVYERHQRQKAHRDEKQPKAFVLLVECQDEADRHKLMVELQELGYTCRAK